MILENLLKFMVDENASDLHIRIGVEPAMRKDNIIIKLKNIGRVSMEQMNIILQQLMTKNQYESFTQGNECDFAVGIKHFGRFRINAYLQRGTKALAIRHIAREIPQFTDLNLPPVILDLCIKPRGLILVTGATGSGKSTTLASMVDHINKNLPINIISIEDPIEFLHRDIKSTISQREIGTDTKSYGIALRHCFRQDPDVLLIGEIRDIDTMTTALQAADTGHLVLSTLHTMNSSETINRIISFYPPHQHQQIRLLLASTLQATISLRLLSRKEGSGRIPATEIMIVTGAIRECLIKPEKTLDIESLIKEGHQIYGSQSFDQSILHLFQQGFISYETALKNTSNPNDFELKVKGVLGTSDRSWT